MYSMHNFQGKVSILNALTNVIRELVSISLVFNTSFEKGGYLKKEKHLIEFFNIIIKYRPNQCIVEDNSNK